MVQSPFCIELADLFESYSIYHKTLISHWRKCWDKLIFSVHFQNADKEMASSIISCDCFKYTNYQGSSQQGENCFLNQPVLYKPWMWFSQFLPSFYLFFINKIPEIKHVFWRNYYSKVPNTPFLTIVWNDNTLSLLVFLTKIFQNVFLIHIQFFNATLDMFWSVLKNINLTLVKVYS